MYLEPPYTIGALPLRLYEWLSVAVARGDHLTLHFQGVQEIVYHSMLLGCTASHHILQSYTAAIYRPHPHSSTTARPIDDGGNAHVRTRQSLTIAILHPVRALHVHAFTHGVVLFII
jgi:hypothetical protein